MESQYIKKRAVFSLSGYDPKGARYYYNLYKREASKEENISVSDKKRTDKHIQSWTVENTSEEKTTHTEYHFLEWDDIVRKEWSKNYFYLILDFFLYIKVYLLGGLFLKYFIKSYRQMEMIFFPLNYMLVSFLLCYFGSFWIFTLLENFLSLFLTWVFTILSALIFMWGLLIWGTKVGLFWLLRSFVFSSKYASENIPLLEQRISYLASHLAEAIRKSKANDIDEIFLLSHSSGTILSIPILAKALKELNSSSTTIPTISILSLGHCIPLVTVIPHSLSYQKEMQYLAEQDNIIWVDYTSVIDTATFPKLNFFEDVNIELKSKENFHLLSPKFHTLYPEKAYKKLKKDKYKAHFLYMMSHPKSTGYNFFTLTSGHKALKQAIKNA